MWLGNTHKHNYAKKMGTTWCWYSVFLVLHLIFWENRFLYFTLFILYFTMFYLFPGEYAGTQGLGLLRLHSTYRHDLKIYASDEGRVQVLFQLSSHDFA